jgi:hypothetical protein
VLKREGFTLGFAVAITVVVVVLAGGTVEIANHIGLITGLGFGEQIPRAIADTGAFAVTSAVLANAWSARRK